MAPIPLWVLLDARFAQGSTIVGATGLAAATGFTAAFAGPNLRAILLNVNLPDRRGSMTALLTLADDVGKALGPALIAGLILIFGRRFAFELTTVAWVLCALVMANLLWSYPADDQLEPNTSSAGRPGSTIQPDFASNAPVFRASGGESPVRSQL